MAWYWRAAVILLGSLGLLFGMTKAYFEIKSWEVMVNAMQRPADVGGDYRVYVRLYLVVAAFGLTLLLLGCLL